MPKSKSLESLRARWLTTDPRRWQMGVSILCPGHMGLDHRIEFWFLVPMDGYLPASERGLVLRSGDTLEDLTLAPLGGDAWGDPLWVPGHWRGWIVDGRVYDYRGPTLAPPTSGAA